MDRNNPFRGGGGEFEHALYFFHGALGEKASFDPPLYSFLCILLHAHKKVKKYTYFDDAEYSENQEVKECYHKKLLQQKS